MTANEATERVVQAARNLAHTQCDDAVSLCAAELELCMAVSALDRLDADRGNHVGDVNKMIAPSDVCECGCSRDAHEAIDGECIVPKCVCLKYRPRVERKELAKEAK